MTPDDEIPACLGPDPSPHRPRLRVPEGACDTHAHVFDAARYPYQATRGYTPPDNGVDRLLALHDALGLSRGVVVQASVHGTDNRAVLDAAAAHPDRLRAIVAVGEDVTQHELEAMHAKGARGIRVNLVDKGGMPFRSLAALGGVADRIRPLGWHVELLVHVEEDPATLRELAQSVRVPVTIGHAGYTKVARGGAGHPGFREFLAMLQDGLFWVKLTGPYRISAESTLPYADVTEMAHRVVKAAPERILWGSDWPHVAQYRAMPNDGALLDLLAEWVPDGAQRDAILRDNPARLYGFG
ncbi:amidohydrolase family protein [Sabulicella rubraurantiaca]|uniref:amidohydrolase family protein n=1 Tax=Sabulicella rubraurantiaca TaxID=2811429 RepID=UPI001A96CC50|nr:amidohydrolase family protein [Sabulicella rubraurantiaca]